jgi:predicted ATPase/DNA-binding SARP family transcriptional activator
VLGHLDVVGQDGDHLDLGGGRDRSVLAALCTDAGAVVDADRVLALVWGDDLPRNPANALQASVSRLRRVLGGDRIRTVKPGYVLVLDRDELDAWVLEDLVERAGRLAPTDPATCELLCDQALALWRGEPFADLDDPAVVPLRSRWRELRTRALTLRASSLVELGRSSEAAAVALPAFEEDVLDQSLAVAAMTALHRSGRQAEALRLAHRHRAALADAGLEVGPTMLAAERAVLDPSSLPGLGRIPPPYYGNRFLGREAELARVTAAVTERRLTTLVGPGGVGKSRLAREVALTARGWWSDLSVLPAGTEPATAVAGQLRIHPSQGAAADDALSDALGPEAGLLVLDDCDGAVEAIARLVSRLLARCPHIHVLATSRQPLGIAGEHLVELGPLTVGQASPASDLFVERARSVTELTDADRPTVAAIVARLDGLPLAIELAAGRLGVVAVDELRSHVESSVGRLSAPDPARPERHRSLTSVVEGSWAQLTDHERQVAAALGVFQGWFTVADAATVTGTSPADCADVVAQLRRISLIAADTRHRPPQFRYLAPIRAFVSDRGPRAGIARPFEEAHRTWVATQLRLATDLLRGPAEIDGVELVARLRPDIDAALSHSPGTPGHAVLAPLAEVVAMRLTAEDASRFVDAVDRDRARDRWVVAGAAQAAFVAGDMARVGRLCATPEGGDVPWLARWVHGSVPLFNGDPDESRRRLATSAAAVTDRWEHAFLSAAAAFAAANAGDDDAVDAAAAVVDAARELGNPTALSWALCAVGTALTERDPGAALDAYEEAVALAAGVANQVIAGLAGPRIALLRDLSVPEVLAEQLAAWQRHGNRSHAVELVARAIPLLAGAQRFDAVATLVAAIGDASGFDLQLPSERARIDAAVATARSALGEERFGTARREAASLGVDDAVAMAARALQQISDA